MIGCFSVPGIDCIVIIMTETQIDIPYELDLEPLVHKLHIKPESDHEKEFNDLVQRVREVANPKALYRESYIQEKGADTVIIDSVTFTSRTLRRNLDEVERTFPYIVTCGTEVDGINIPQDDFLLEFWLDVIKEALLRIGVRYFVKHLEQKFKLGKTSAMSPGSGDANVWPIMQQRELFSLFSDVESLIGVRLTDSFLMLPNKTVSGMRFQTEVDFQTCELCHRENCVNRRAPFNKKLWESVQVS